MSHQTIIKTHTALMPVVVEKKPVCLNVERPYLRVCYVKTNEHIE